MKSPSMRKKFAPQWCHVISMICLIASQIVITITESANEPNLQLNDDQQFADEKLRINRDLLEPTNANACPHCNSISEMPMELADKINEINDVDIFVHDFVEDTNSLSNFTSISQHPASRRRRAARSDQPRQATCQPIESIVSVVPPEERDPTVFYFPSCIKMMQCGGCCAHSGTTCSPIDENEKQITLKKTKFVGGPKGFQSMGDVTITVKEHTKCKCQCKKTAADCNGLQKFIPSQCRCECQNYDEQDKCSKEPLKLWDIKSCSCVCHDTKDCSSGNEFDQQTCSCQPITDDEYSIDEYSSPFFGEHQFNETNEAEDSNKYEHIYDGAHHEE